MQKEDFDHNFQTKALRITILAPRSSFLRSRNPMVSFLLTYELDLSMSWPLRNDILDHISVAKMLPNFNTRSRGSGPFNKSKYIVSGLNVRRSWTPYVVHHYAKRYIYVFDHNFWTKALRMTTLVSRSMFVKLRNLVVPFIFTYDLNLSMSWPLHNHILGHISIING